LVEGGRGASVIADLLSVRHTAPKQYSVVPM
jgi:hypothetical protein